MRTRPHYLPIDEADAGMVLGAPVRVVHQGILKFSLPTGHVLTADNLRQLAAHHAEYIFIAAPDERSDEQVAADAAVAAHRVVEIFSGADLDDPLLMGLFDQILMYRSA